MKQHFNSNLRNLASLLAVAGAAIVMGNAHSQETEGAKPSRATRVAMRPAQDETSIADDGGVSSDESSGTPAGAPDQPQVPDDHPAVLAIQESNPSTPLTRLRAAKTLQDLGRVDLAQNYLDQVLAESLEDPELYDLQQELGTPYFFGLYRSEAYSEETRQFARQVLAAAYAESRKPERLQGWVSDLSADDSRVRATAVLRLEEVGVAAAAPLFEVLADDSATDQHPIIARTLYDLSRGLEGPLRAALDAPQDRVRQVALEILGRRRNPAALPSLVFASVSEEVPNAEQNLARDLLTEQFRVAPSLEEARTYLLGELRRYQQGALPNDLDENQAVKLWVWNDEAQSPKQLTLNPVLASSYAATQVADRLYRLSPEDPQVQVAYLSTLIETERRTQGMDAALSESQVAKLAREFGVDRVERVLIEGMRQQLPVAAAGAAELLGELGSADELLVSRDGRPRPLVKALRHGDRRLRFAATMAILQLNPRTAYPGSSYLIDSLFYFLGSAGQRRVLIGHTRQDQAQTLAAEFRALGYESDIAAYGRDLFLKAVAHPDYEIILISDSLTRPEANELVQQLRKDPRTSKLPIGLLARREHLPRVRRIAMENPLTLAVPWPYEPSSVQFTAYQLRSSVGSEFVDAERRLEQALSAAEALSELVDEREELGFYNVIGHEERLRDAFYTPELTADVAHLLGSLGTPTAQRELINYASQPLLPAELRTEAVDAFELAIERRGVLLRSKEVLRQYDRYNQSGTLGPETQQILGRILDLIEASNQRPLRTHDVGTASPLRR